MLPNGSIFYAKYKQTTRADLLVNVRLSDRINKEHHLKEDVAAEEYNKGEEVLKAHLVN